jgi:hypothetical protein
MKQYLPHTRETWSAPSAGIHAYKSDNRLIAIIALVTVTALIIISVSAINEDKEMMGSASTSHVITAGY